MSETRTSTTLPAPRPLRVLLVENDRPDAELTIAALAKCGYDVKCDVVDTLPEFEQMLTSESFDLVLADYRLPDWTGMDALEALQRLQKDIPLILVTGTLGEDAAVECIKRGVSDYVLKGRLTRLPHAIQRALEERTLITERKRAEEALRASQDRLQRLIESSPVGILMADVQGRIFEANHAFLSITGHTRADFNAGKVNWKKLIPHDRHLEKQAFRQLQKEGTAAPVEREYVRKDGTRVPVMVGAALLEGSRDQFVAFVLDLTERKRLEDQLRQALKMQAVGQLAGGIAHDFNNLLGVIIGYADLLRQTLKADKRLLKYAEEVKEAGERAARLTRQLLAFSRQQVLQPRVLDLNDALLNSEKLLRRLIGEHIDFAVVRGEGLGKVKADPGQVEQVLMNLAVNARDAMPQGGMLSIRTANAELDAGYARLHAYVKPGPYVMLAVSDTGTGMDVATQARIFEPFFTTKERSKGTGLGLATVHGIVKQSGGHICAYSEPGHGTTFKIYFPRVEGTADAAASVDVEIGSLPRGKETILLVEDADPLRNLTREYLETNGYTVLEAQNGVNALDISNEHRSPIHLMITDVIMPKMNGRELAERLERARPDLKVLYMSGYPDEIISHQGVLEQGVSFLQKPFSPREILCKIREVLDAAGPKKSAVIESDASIVQRGP